MKAAALALAAFLAPALAAALAPALAAALASPSSARAATIQADALIPLPPPSAPLSAWTDAPGRTRVSLDRPGVALRGWLFEGGRPDGPLLVLFGGNTSLVSAHADTIARFARNARGILAYDYRGFGFSAGAIPHMADFRDDAVAILDAAADRAGGPGQVVAIGFSLGTAIACHVATTRAIGGLVLIAPIANAATEIPYILKVTGLGSLHADDAPALVADIDETGMVARLTMPLLVAQSVADEIVPVPQGRMVFDASASADKRFVAIATPGHLPSFLASQTAAAVDTFLVHRPILAHQQ